jgi:hypothetical protein
MNNIVSLIMLGYSLADPSILPSVQVKGYYPNLIECNKHMDMLYEGNTELYEKGVRKKPKYMLDMLNQKVLIVDDVDTNGRVIYSCNPKK